MRGRKKKGGGGTKTGNHEDCEEEGVLVWCEKKGERALLAPREKETGSIKKKKSERRRAPPNWKLS